MKYAVTMYHKDGFVEKNIANNAKERNFWIKTCKAEGFIRSIIYNPIYRSGESGKRLFVKF